MVKLLLDEHEASLLRDIRGIVYGEIYGVVSQGNNERTTSMDVTSAERSFILALREVREFDIVTVHDGQPRYGETRTRTPGGRTCMIKSKFQ